MEGHGIPVHTLLDTHGLWGGVVGVAACADTVEQSGISMTDGVSAACPADASFDVVTCAMGLMFMPTHTKVGTESA